MQPDIVIKNGYILDTTAGKEGVGSVYVKGKKIIAESAVTKDAKYTIDASGCLVVPGLIDSHAHIFDRGTESGIPHAYMFTPSGVTTVVDAGSSGSATFAEFYNSIVAPSRLRLKSLLSVNPTGQPTRKFHEYPNSSCWDEDAVCELAAEFPEVIVGLKARISKEIVHDFGIKYLEEAVRLGEKAGLRVHVHATNPPVPMDEVAAILRPGDVLSHMYHGHGHTLLDGKGTVAKGIWKARERGVIFDAANGTGHFSLPVVRAALAEGFLPDTLGTDLTTLTEFKEPAMGLAYLMSKYLNLGLDEKQVVRMTTTASAKWLGMEDQIGTLAPGACADVTILRKIEKRTKFSDTFGDSFYGDQMLIPQLTMVGGHILFRQMDFVAP